MVRDNLDHDRYGVGSWKQKRALAYLDELEAGKEDAFRLAEVERGERTMDLTRDAIPIAKTSNRIAFGIFILMAIALAVAIIGW